MRTTQLPLRRNGEPSSSQEMNRLPGVEAIMSGLEPHLLCQTCLHIFPSNDLRHDCYAAGDESQTPTRGGPFTPYYGNGSMSPACSTRNGFSELPTPTSSRSASVAGSAEGGYGSSVDIPDERKCSKCGFACAIADHVKRENKKAKEQMARQLQAEVLQNAEDMFSCIFDWNPSKTQSSGNGNAAGVETPKIDLLRNLLYITRTQLESGLMKAIEADREEEWKAEMRRKTNSFLALFNPSEDYPRGRPWDPSFDGSWMELPDKVNACRKFHGKGAKGGSSKRCRTHPESGLSHVECRKCRRTAIFKERRAAFRKRMAAAKRN